MPATRASFQKNKSLKFSDYKEIPVGMNSVPVIDPRIRKYLFVLDNIERNTRRKFQHCQAFAMYQFLIEVCRHWRSLESRGFYDLDKAGTDELYWHINLRIRTIFNHKLDLYWLISGYDGSPLYSDGRDVDRFFVHRWHEHGVLY